MLFALARGLLFAALYATATPRLVFVGALADLLALFPEALWWGVGGRGARLPSRKLMVYALVGHSIPAIFHGFPFAGVLLGSKWVLGTFLGMVLSKGVRPVALLAVGLACVFCLLPFLSGFFEGEGLEGGFLHCLEIVGPHHPLMQLATVLGIDLQRGLPTVYGSPFGDRIAFTAAPRWQYLLWCGIGGGGAGLAAWWLRRRTGMGDDDDLSRTRDLTGKPPAEGGADHPRTG